jgi:GNAT superfamily N-acetyltransferase
MQIVLHDDPVGFARQARPVLEADPLRHTMALTVLDALCRGGDPAAALLTAHEDGAVVAAALRTPGRPALVSAVPPAHAAAVEAALAAADRKLPGAGGPTAEAEAFAAAHAARTGNPVHVSRRMRLFALDRIVPPTGLPGAARCATEDDIAVLARWRRAFAEEDAHIDRGPMTPEETVARSLRLGCGELLWEVDGEPVAQATARPVVATVSRIGPVYTPPEHRRHGYAAAVTAAATRWALDAGAERVLLFTDLADPTTNRLYPRLGYRPVYDAVELGFGSA